MVERRAGIVLVTDCRAGRFRLCLPSEHRLVASRYRDAEQTTEWLVEGPTLPIVADGAPEATVEIYLTATFDVSGYHLHARWRHQPEGSGWHVGDWPDYEALQSAIA